MTTQLISQQYEKRRSKKTLFIALFILLLFTSAILAIVIGSADIKMSSIYNSLWHYLFNKDISSEDMRLSKIIFLLRMPRVLLGILAGVGLSISGTIMQSITRNPLVSPFTVGISSAAAFGASLSIVLGWGLYPGSTVGIVVNAFLMSLICGAVVYFIANKIGMGAEALILTGIALSYLFSAFTATLQFIADENQLSAAIQWGFGSLNGSTWNQVIVVGIIVVVSFLFLLSQSWKLNAMASSSDDFVKGIGMNPARIRTIHGIFSVIITASIISFTGVIGFVGLVSPHISRMIIGNDHRYLLPVSALVGAMLLLISDTVGRTILSPVTIPVGIVISYLGVPLFIHLIYTGRRDGI